MPAFSANLELLFPELPFFDRFGAAAELGFSSVEYMFPYAQDIGRIRRLLDENGLRLDLFNLPAGDFAAGERGIAGDPARRDEFASGVEAACRIANELGCRKLNCLAGFEVAGERVESQRACLVSNLQSAVASTRVAGIQLMVELLNPVENPGFLLSRMSDVHAVLQAVPGLSFQCDVYHLQRANGELINTITQIRGHIGHFQIADAPDRHEPGTGEINYRTVFRAIDEIGYPGRIGLEYRPSTSTAESLSWVMDYGYKID